MIDDKKGIDGAVLAVLVISLFFTAIFNILIIVLLRKTIDAVERSNHLFMAVRVINDKPLPVQVMNRRPNTITEQKEKKGENYE